MGYIECSYTGGGETPDLLWTNPSPTSSFASPQTINIDLSNYEALLIENEGSVANVVTSSKRQISYIDLSETDYVFCSSYDYGGLMLSLRRIIEHTNSSITIGGGFAIDPSHLTVVSTNNASVPLKIYGLKNKF